MSEPVSSHSAGTATAGATPFTAEDWLLFRSTDWTAGAYIVGLMAGIFTIGLVLYLIVLLSTLS
jgi:hypothetical protein